jgi:cold shock CspA family protein
MKGKVKWWNDAKGYGFIEAETGEDVFVHYSALQMEGFQTLTEGEAVTFEVAPAPKGLQASQVVREADSKPAAPRRAPVKRALRVFLCHASADKVSVRELYRKLKSAFVDPWLDEEKLLPGQDWNLEISKAIRQSDAVLVCLSRGSVTKAGYVQKEIRDALDIADQQPEGTIYLIPVRLEDCEVPERLRRWHWVNLFDSEGHQRLLRALTARGESLGLSMS